MGDSTDRPKRPGGPPTGKRPDSGRPAKGAPSSRRAPSGRGSGDGDLKRNSDGPSRPSAGGQRNERPMRDGGKSAWKRPEGEKPAWKQSEGGKSAWKRPEGEKPAWKQAEGGKSAWKRPESDNHAASRRDGDRSVWKRPDGDRDSPRRDGDRPVWKRPEGDRAAPRRDAPRRDGDNRDTPRRDSDRRSGPSRDAGGRRDEPRLWTRAGSPARGDSSASSRELPEDRDPYGTKSVRARHDAPEIPEEILPNQLDRVARAQLKTLSKENADEVARHMVMAASLISEDPELAHAHAVSAGRRAGRIAVVRETLAITAYSIGDFALALRELRTYRRISGRDDQLPMMVDCERGLGRPEKALELGRSVPRAGLPVEVQVELAISMSGARLDLGQTDAALIELQIPQLDPDTAFTWSPALFDAYGTVLEDLGRTDEAQTWFNRSDVATAALSSGDESDDLEIEVFEEDGDEEDGDLEAGDLVNGDDVDGDDGDDLNGDDLNGDDLNGDDLNGDEGGLVYAGGAEEVDKSSETSVTDVAASDDEASQGLTVTDNTHGGPDSQTESNHE